jgi:uncharacterized protein YkwD
MALKIPKFRKTQLVTTPVVTTGVGSSSSVAIPHRRALKRWQAILFILVFVGAGYMIIRSFAYNTCYNEVCVVLPDQNAIYSENFHVRTRVTLAQDRDSYNVKVILDKDTSSEQVVDARRQSFKLTRGTVKEYNFFYGSPKSSPAGDNLYFDRSLLTPGKHTITAEMRTGDLPGQGVLYSSHAVSFTATNVRNLASSREPAKTFYAKNFPYNGLNTPRYAKVSPSAKSRVNQTLAKVDQAVFPKAYAHTGQHGNLVNTVYVDDPFDGSTTRDSRRGGVTVRAELYSRTDTNCHDSDNTNKVEYTNSQGHFMIRGETDNTQGTNHGMITFATCPVGGYNISIDVPDGFHIHPNSAVTKQVQLADNENKSIEFTIQPNDDDGDRTPNYRDSCPRNAGYSTTYPGCPDIPPGCTYPGQQIPRPPANTRGPIYRYYSGAAGGFHYYSMERNDWGYVQGGLCFEGIEGYAYSNQVPGTVPLYHFYNPGNYDHFYGRNYSEGINAGYQYQGVEAYVENSPVEGTVPFQRYYSPCGNSDHFYRANAYVEGIYCYGHEGNEGYVYTSGGVYVADRTYRPTQPPLLTLTSLSATSAEVDLFGFGWNRSGDPSREVYWITAKVDGVYTDNHSLTGYQPQSMAALIAERVYLGNLADGKYHRVEIATGNTYVPTILTFFVDPVGPYSGVSASGGSAQQKEALYAEQSGATSNVGSVNVATWENTNEGDNAFKDRAIGYVVVKTDNIGGNECPVTSTKTYSSGSITFTRCPVGINNSPKYPKSYYVSAIVPSGYHVDKKYAALFSPREFKIFTNSAGQTEVRRKIKLLKDKTKNITFVFAKNTASVVTTQPLPESTYNRAEEDATVEEINKNIRRPKGLTDLIIDEGLRQVARSHALDMMVHNFFGHVGYDCSHSDERMKAAGYNNGYYGENVGWGVGSLSSAWAIIWGAAYPDKYNKEDDPTKYDESHGYMNSPGHRRNILDPNFKYTGVGHISGIASYTPTGHIPDSDGRESCTLGTTKPSYANASVHVQDFFAY